MLRGLVDDDAVEEESEHVESNLEQVTIDYILQEVSSDADRGRAVDGRDGQLVRLLLQCGLDTEQCKLVLLHHLTTGPAVAEAMQITLGAAPSATAAAVAPIFRAFLNATYGRPPASLAKLFVEYLRRACAAACARRACAPRAPTNAPAAARHRRRSTRGPSPAATPCWIYNANISLSYTT